jgi:hypothetical protein
LATQNLASADAYLKNVYYGPWVEQLNQETAILDVLEKTNANDMGTFGGRQLIFVAHSNRNRGRGGMTDGGQLATAGAQGGVDGIVNIKYFDVAIELSDQVIKQTKTDPASFVRQLTFEMEMAQKDMRKDVTRIAYGTGDGLFASCTTTQATINTFAVDSGQYIAVGDTVDIIVRATGATGTGALARAVTAVAFTGTPAGATQANANITVGGGTISVDNTYGVYLAGDRSLESDGLRNICSTGRTLHQINSATAGNGFWDSNIKDFANAAPSEDGVMQLAQQIRQRSGFTPKFGMMTLGGQRRLANTYTADKRFNDNNATEYKGGYDTIFVSAGGNPLPMRADVDAPCGQFFLINDDGLCWSQIGPPDWLQPPDDKGSVFQLKSGATAGTWQRIWQAWMIWDACLVSIAPNRQGKAINVFDDVPVARI